MTKKNKKLLTKNFYFITMSLAKTKLQGKWFSILRFVLFETHVKYYTIISEQEALVLIYYNILSTYLDCMVQSSFANFLIQSLL